MYFVSVSSVLLFCCLHVDSSDISWSTADMQFLSLRQFFKAFLNNFLNLFTFVTCYDIS